MDNGQKKTSPVRKATIPVGARKPEDRKPKADSGSGDVTVTVDGRDWIVPRAAMDDFEVLDDMASIEAGDMSRMPAVLRRLIGDQWREAMASLRDSETGRVTVEAGAVFLNEIVRGLDPNSSRSSG